MRLLIDTQVFLWFIMGNERLKKRFKDHITDSSNKPFLSIVSLWEIAIKSSIGKLSLRTTFKELAETQVTSFGFTLVPVEITHLIELEKLPHHHRDPFDRLIIAQSIAENLTLITSDPEFDLYAIEKLV